MHALTLSVSSDWFPAFPQSLLCFLSTCPLTALYRPPSLFLKLSFFLLLSFFRLLLRLVLFLCQRDHLLNPAVSSQALMLSA